MDDSRENALCPFNHSFRPRGEPAAKVLAYLNGRSLHPLTEIGWKEHNACKEKRDPNKLLITPELCGYKASMSRLDPGVDVATFLNQDDGVIQRTHDSFEAWKKRRTEDILEQVLVPQGLEGVLTSMCAAKRCSLLDQLLQETASCLLRRDSDENGSGEDEEPISHSQPMPMSLEDSRSVGSSVVGEELEGHKAHRLMFQKGKNRIQPKTFEIPGREDATVTRTCSTYWIWGVLFRARSHARLRRCWNPTLLGFVMPGLSWLPSQYQRTTKAADLPVCFGSPF